MFTKLKIWIDKKLINLFEDLLFPRKKEIEEKLKNRKEIK